MTRDELTAIELLAQTVTDRSILHRYVLALCREVRRLTAELAKRPTFERALAAAELALNDLYDDLEQELPEDPA